MRALDWTQPRRVVVMRPDHIGDLVVSTGAFRAVREAAPQAEIWGVVSKAARDLMVTSGWCDRWITPEDQHLLPVFAADVALGLSPRTATHRLLVASRARRRVGCVYAERPLARLACWWWLTDTWSVSLARECPHEAEIVARFGREAGLARAEARPELRLPSDLLAWGRDYAAGRRLLHLAPRWLDGWSWEQLCELLLRLSPVIVTYGPAEKSLLPAQLPELPGVEWLGGQDVLHWAALLGGAGCVLSVDTGAVHVAAALGAPVVMLHLPQHAALCSRQWYPFGVPSRMLVKGEFADTSDALAAAARQLHVKRGS